MAMGITPREAECLAFIENTIAEKGFAPTCEEIAGALDLKSKSGAVRLLNGLEARGRIRRLPRCSRGIQVLPTDKMRCPHCGHRAGGAECVAAARASEPMPILGRQSAVRP